MSLFSKPTVPAAERWLKFKKASEILGFDERTIKRWMRDPAKRKALGVVRHGKQWRIPSPQTYNAECEWAWESHTRYRLKRIGVTLNSNWENEIQNLGRQHERYQLEAYRLWLAAYIKALGQGRITQKVKTNILLLWQTACTILASQKSLRHEFDTEKLKQFFPIELRGRGVSLKSVMQHWPKGKHFRILHAAYIKSDLEIIRRELDFWQAYRDESRRRRGGIVTAENLRHLLHKDLMAHLNDMRDEAYPALIEYRQDQPGISLRSFRSRYPQKKQKPIIAKISRILSETPSLGDERDKSKTLVRGPKLLENEFKMKAKIRPLP